MNWFGMQIDKMRTKPGNHTWINKKTNLDFGTLDRTKQQKYGSV